MDSLSQQERHLSNSSLRCIFVFLGMGTLFCYNAFVSCTDYFNALNPSKENVSGQMVTFQLTTMFIVTIALLPFTTLKRQEKRSEHSIGSHGSHLAFIAKVMNIVDLSSPAKRILYGFAFTFIFLFAYLLLPPSNLTSSTLNLFSTFVGIADATSQSGLYVLAANYSQGNPPCDKDESGHENGSNPTYTASATLGAALSGFIVSALRLITRSMFDTTTLAGLRKGADLLMWFAFIVSFLLVGAAIVMMRDLQCRARNACMGSTPSFEMQLQDEMGIGQANDDDNDNIRSEVIHQCKEGALIECDDVSQMHGDDVTRQSSRIQMLGNIYRSAFRVAWKPILSAFLNFFITLSLFPGVIVDIPSSGGTISLGNWLPIVLLTVFNGADCLGRYILSFESMAPFQLLVARRESCATYLDEKDGHQIRVQGHATLKYYTYLVWIPTFGRIAFFPLLAMCMLPSGSPKIHSDILTCIIVFLFGLSSGFIHCANFIIAPILVNSEEGKNAVSLLLLLAIYSGLTLGAFFGLFVEKVIRDIND
jgi:hypothetical protein